MDIIINFVRENWIALSGILLGFCGVILGAITTAKCCHKKAHVSLEAVLPLIPQLIIEAEKKYSDGSKKLEYVLCSCIKFLSEQFKVSQLDLVNKYGSFIISVVEKTLETPVKKGF